MKEGKVVKKEWTGPGINWDEYKNNYSYLSNMSNNETTYIPLLKRDDWSRISPEEKQECWKNKKISVIKGIINTKGRHDVNIVIIKNVPIYLKKYLDIYTYTEEKVIDLTASKEDKKDKNFYKELKDKDKIRKFNFKPKYFYGSDDIYSNTDICYNISQKGDSIIIYEYIGEWENLYKLYTDFITYTKTQKSNEIPKIHLIDISNILYNGVSTYSFCIKITSFIKDKYFKKSKDVNKDKDVTIFNNVDVNYPFISSLTTEEQKNIFKDINSKKIKVKEYYNPLQTMTVTLESNEDRNNIIKFINKFNNNFYSLYNLDNIRIPVKNNNYICDDYSVYVNGDGTEKNPGMEQKIIKKNTTFLTEMLKNKYKIHSNKYDGQVTIRDNNNYIYKIDNTNKLKRKRDRKEDENQDENQNKNQDENQDKNQNKNQDKRNKPRERDMQQQKDQMYTNTNKNKEGGYNNNFNELFSKIINQNNDYNNNFNKLYSKILNQNGGDFDKQINNNDNKFNKLFNKIINKIK